MIRFPRLTIATLCAVAACLGAAPAAHAGGYTTYWPSLYQSSCGYSDVGSVAPNDIRSRGNYGYNRRYSILYVNGGYWSWGAYYTSGSYFNTTHSQSGQWSGSVEVNYWSSQQTNPFIRNLNGSWVGASGCFWWQ